MSEIFTLSKDNLFSFKCPVMNSDVQIRTCVHLRFLVYRGERREVRRGCQACISSGKCPAAEIVRRFAFNASNATDHCASVEEKHGKLPADVLDRVSAIVVHDHILTTFESLFL